MWEAFLLSAVVGVVASIAAGGLLLKRLVGSLRGIIRQFYLRLDAIEGELRAIRRGHDGGGPVADPGPPVVTALPVGNFLHSESVAAHLDALRSGSLSPCTYSYAMSRACRSVNPTILRRGTSDTVICSVALGDRYRDQVASALASQECFAEAKGFSYALLAEPPSFSDRPPAWMKIPLLAALLQQGFRRGVYIDADALVTNLDVDIDGCFARHHGHGSIRLTEDEDGINTGVMFLEDGPAIRRILDLTWQFDADIQHATWEQHALKTLMDRHDSVRQYVAIEPDPRLFNSFPVERNRFHRTMERSTWRPGDFICHFSGIRAPDLEPLIETYATQIAPLRRYASAA